MCPALAGTEALSLPVAGKRQVNAGAHTPSKASGRHDAARSNMLAHVVADCYGSLLAMNASLQLGIASLSPVDA